MKPPTSPPARAAMCRQTLRQSYVATSTRYPPPPEGAIASNRISLRPHEAVTQRQFLNDSYIIVQCTYRRFAVVYDLYH
ncbi:unnamed protein product [Leptosia nina]|uniref:Uncharacterized protein n=1 Tax=Leptosia nina TaxID=320188 RepID=A0AAV1IWV1_9NEOP